MSMGTKLYPLPGGDGDETKVWYPLGLGMRQKFDTRWVWVWDGDEYFLWGWVWDSETRPRSAPLPSLWTCSS